jgi:VIT1/CCC1 family predicted Fe2+/Mn2+ transporter
MRSHHQERHRTERIGWLRAAVLGVNDGIVSTASLVLGIAAAETTRASVLVAGVAMPANYNRASAILPCSFTPQPEAGH